jgi:hypothetical protein
MTLHERKHLGLAAAIFAATLLAACSSTGPASPAAESKPASTTSTSAPASAPAAAPAKPAATATSKGGAAPGMNDKGEVVDSSKVEGGTGTKVKGPNGTEGEVFGKPAKNSKFTKLTMGMSMKQVTDLIGQPTDQGAYITGKAWIPFYFGSDRYRYELAYKGQGRLVFAGDSGFTTMGGGNLIRIVHNANDTGYR